MYSDLTPPGTYGNKVVEGEKYAVFKLEPGEGIKQIEVMSYNSGACRTFQITTTDRFHMPKRSSGPIGPQGASTLPAFGPTIFGCPHGHEIMGWKIDENPTAHQFTTQSVRFKDVSVRPFASYAGSGISESSSLDLASLLAPASILSSSDPGQRWGRVFQVSIVRVLLESAIQSCLAGIAFELSYESMEPGARIKQVLSLTLSIIAAIPKLTELLELSATYRAAAVLCGCLAFSLAWASLKVLMGYYCEDHLWSLTTGCVSEAARSS